MNVAVFSDKFSGTLTAKEALDTIKDVFQASDINAEFFSVTDGGEGSTQIFKEYGFEQFEVFKSFNCDEIEVEVESLNINGLKYFESAQLVGINSTKDTLEINSASLSEVVQKINILGTGGSKTVDFGVGLLSKIGIDFLSNGERIVNPTPKDFPLINNVKAEAHRLKRPINIKFMEWTPGNHRQVREEIKERCNRLKEFNKHWWIKVVPGAPGSPNYQIEVSHSNRRRFIKN